MSFLSAIRRRPPSIPNAQLTRREAQEAAYHFKRLHPGSEIMPVGGLSQSMSGYLKVPCYGVYRHQWDRLKVGDEVFRYTQRGVTIHMASYHDGKGNWKTTGLGNRRTDPGWMTEKDYMGTLIQPFPYIEETHT